MGQEETAAVNRPNYTPSIRSTSGRGDPFSPHTLLDLQAEDPLDQASSTSAPVNFLRSTIADILPSRVTVPAISMTSEYPSIVQGSNRRGHKQTLTAMITIQIPAAGERRTYSSFQQQFSNMSGNQVSAPLPPNLCIHTLRTPFRS